VDRCGSGADDAEGAGQWSRRAVDDGVWVRGMAVEIGLREGDVMVGSELAMKRSGRRFG
jgi:hypothetical protein